MSTEKKNQHHVPPSAHDDCCEDPRTIGKFIGKAPRLLFLFTDVVAYSREPDGRQLTIVKNLQEMVNRSALFQLMEPQGIPWKHTIILPTGDGLAFCFANSTLFAHPKQLLTFAEFLNEQCSAHNIELRIGVHSEDGQIYRDINGNINVAGNGINIAQRVMSQADARQILASGAFYKVVAAKYGENEATKILRPLGNLEVKHGVSLEMFLYHNTRTPCLPFDEPSKQSDRRHIQEHIQSHLRRIEEKWHTRLAEIAKKETGDEPEFRVTLLYLATSPLAPDKNALMVTFHSYMRNKPWNIDRPPQVIFEEGQGPFRALAIKAIEKNPAPKVSIIKGLPDTEGIRDDKDNKQIRYCKELNKKSGTPIEVIKALRRHARSFFYIPFGFGEERNPWDGVISIDSSCPFSSVRKDDVVLKKAVEDIRDDQEAIGYLWKLLKRI